MKNDRYHELFERSADANLIIVDEKVVDCNTATIKMLGYKNKQEVLKAFNTHPSQLSPEFQPDGQLSYVKANEI
jgi:PAS domain-containing protein